MCVDLKCVHPGDVVIVERHPDDKDSKGNPLSAYESGEYVVTDINELSLGAIHIGANGYELSQSRRFRLVGQDRWVISARRRGEKTIGHMIATIDRFVDDVRQGGKKQWIDSVYDRAEANAAVLRDLLASCGCEGVGAPPKAVKEVVERLPTRLTNGTWLLVNGAEHRVPAGAEVKIDGIGRAKNDR